jgi:hydroxymethylpyrimidine/phosphomethylpyrimidine kinase
LTIAGSDPSGGAGIQADLKTFAAFNTYGMSAITAVTVQNTLGVRAIHNIPPDIVSGQIVAILEDIGVDAVKTGMLGNDATIDAVAEVLEITRDLKLIVDPVMVATSGAPLIRDGAAETLQRRLFHIATLITPNIPEAEKLSGMKIISREDIVTAANILLQRTAAVLIKGGHQESSDTCSDLLATRDGLRTWMDYPRIQTQNTHGTGCSLAAAIAAGLASGENLETSVRTARSWLQGAIAAAARWSAARGCGPIHHGWQREPR